MHRGHGYYHNHTTTTSMTESPVELRWRIALSTLSLTFGVLASVVFALRIYAATKLAAAASSKARAEHVLMGIGLVLMWGTVGSVLLKAYNGIGLSKWQIPPDREILLYFGSWLVPKFWASSTACCKISIIFFLSRVIAFRPSVRTTLVLVAFTTVAWALTTIFYTTLACQPVAFFWDKSIRGHCLPRHAYKIGNIVIAVFGMLTDMVLLAIPMPTLWASQMRKSQKMAMTAVFGIGLFVCIFSMLRVVQFFYLDLDHMSTSTGLETLWTVLENEFSVICGCAPQLAPLFKSLRSSSKSSSPGYTGSYGTSSLGTHAKMSVIRTAVSGTAAAAAIVMPSLRSATFHNRSSSEFERKGIEVHTAIDQVISAQRRLTDSGRSLTGFDVANYIRI